MDVYFDGDIRPLFFKPKVLPMWVGKVLPMCFLYPGTGTHAGTGTIIAQKNF